MTGIRKHIVCFGLMLLSFGNRSFAQTPTFEAAVDKNPVGLGEQLTLSFTLAGASLGGGKNLQLPDLSKFHIMSGPNQSSSVQVINGAVSSSITYTYILQPKEMGKFTIGAASIEVSGTVLKSAPLTLEVEKAVQRPSQPGGTQGQTVDLGDNLFLRAVVDKSHVVQGEQLNLTFKLYTRVSVVNYSMAKVPTMTGFWSEDAEMPKNITLTTETVNGKSYRVGIIKRSALFATQAGTLEVGPMEAQATVQVQYRSNDAFDAFFRDPFGKNVNYAVKSEPLKIKVDPLPPGGSGGIQGSHRPVCDEYCNRQEDREGE